MKNSRMKICSLLLLAVIGITGCGDKLTTLTADQENMVISYSAHIIAKYNKNQSDGLADMGKSTESTMTSEQPKDKTQVTQTKNESSDTTTTQSSNAQESKAATTATTQATTSSEVATQPALEQKALGDALGITPITATVSKYGIENQITDQNFTFTLSPETGKASLVLHIDLTNTGNSDATCDILSKNAIFQVILNGNITAVSESSSLQSDLSAYNQVIKANATNQAVLIFSIPQDSAANIQSLEIVTKVNDVSSTTKIL